MLEAVEKKKEKEGSIKQKKKEIDFRSNQRKFFVVMLKQLLRSTQSERELFAIVLEVVILKAEEAEVKAVKLQTIAYNRKAQSGEAADLGPPHIYALAGLLQGLEARGD